MRGTSYDFMLILNGSDREVPEVVDSFEEYVKDTKGRFRKQDIKETISKIKNIGDGQTITIVFTKKPNSKFDSIHTKASRGIHEYDWHNTPEEFNTKGHVGMVIEGYIAKHCGCRDMEKYGDCEHDVDF